MSNAIFLDFKPSDDWQFLKELEENTGKKFDCIFNDSHNWHGKKKILRYLSYFFVPLKYALKNKYEVIVAWQQFYGLFYAFWLRLLKKKKSTKLVIMTFIYKKKTGIIGRIYDRIMKYIIGGEYIDKYICFSKEECDKYSRYFNISAERFVSCRLEIEDCCSASFDGSREEDYYLAAGRSNRDYDFLCKAFSSMPERKLIIICDEEQPKHIPLNVTWKNNIHGKEYLNYLSLCKGVIVPLNAMCGDISAGQMVMLQGMMLSKIVLVTETVTTKEYIDNKNTGLLIHNDCIELGKMLDDIECGKYDYIKKSARKYYEDNFSKANTAALVAEIVKEMERVN